MCITHNSAKNDRPNFYSRRSFSAFYSVYLIDSALMSAALKGGIYEHLDEFAGKTCTHNSCADAQHICVVMRSCELS